jgi:predicted membrane protein
MNLGRQARASPPNLYLLFLCAAAPLVALSVAPSLFTIVGSFLVASVGWIAFWVSKQLTKRLYVQAVLGAAICTTVLYSLEIWRAAHLKQTFKWRDQFIYIHGKITAAGVWEVLLMVGKCGVAFALVVVVLDWITEAQQAKSKLPHGS